MPMITHNNDINTLGVIISSKKIYPKITPNIGIRYATWDWNIKPLFFKILNLSNQAMPVATTPK